uniref:Uncharacterized protein n=1 Tax=Arundo donax TaxID=35708 RepID=A0A0A8Z6B3_ARUDO
MIQNHYLEF